MGLTIADVTKETYLEEDEIINAEKYGACSEKVASLLGYFYLYIQLKSTFPKFEAIIDKIDNSYKIPEEFLS